MKVSVIIPTVPERDTAALVAYSFAGADEIITIIDQPRMQVVARMNEAYKKTTGDIIVFALDRTIAAPDWKEKLEKAFKRIQYNGVVNFAPNIVIHGAANREFIENELGGYFAWPDYIHYFYDFELGEKARTWHKYCEDMSILQMSLPKPENKNTPDCAPFDSMVHDARRIKGYPNESVGFEVKQQDGTVITMREMRKQFI